MLFITSSSKFVETQQSIYNQLLIQLTIELFRRKGVAVNVFQPRHIYDIILLYE